ncbi:MAG TPA: hypothetical protein VGB76_20605 [Pyrinomonadaceae bacterium]|jgi:hypothetical protein
MSDKPNEKSRKTLKWRRDLAYLMQQERELSGLKTREEYPKHGDYQKQVETQLKPPDLSYLLRLMMWLNYKQKPLPSRRRLRKLLILWCLMRVESIIENEERFHKEVVTDYEIIPPKPEGTDKKANEEYKKEIDRIFQQKWKKSALEVQEYFEEMLYPVYQELEGQRERIQVTPDRLPTLESFPEAFEPLVVVVGGYGGLVCREPEHISELFRQSQSFVNLHYLLGLNLSPDTEIVSDRLLLELNNDRERATELLGNKHVLVIGSPLVNAFSRHLILKKKLIFNFVLRKETYRLGQDLYRDMLEGDADHNLLGEGFYDSMIKTKLLETPPALSMFYRLMNKPPEEVDLRSPDYNGVEMAHRRQIEDMVFRIRELVGDSEATNEKVTNMFRPKEMFSPLDRTLHDADGNSNQEFAVISLAENYWANLLRKKEEPPKFASIVVAGVNELSTTVAVRALSKKSDLRERPLGGLLDIRKPPAPGLKRITGAGDKWLTLPYEAQDVLRKVDLALESFERRPSAFNLFDDQRELGLYREIVKRHV